MPLRELDLLCHFLIYQEKIRMDIVVGGRYKVLRDDTLKEDLEVEIYYLKYGVSFLWYYLSLGGGIIQGVPLKRNRHRQYNYFHGIEKSKEFNLLKKESMYLWSKHMRKEAWDDVSEWIQSRCDSLKNTRGHIHTHEDHDVILFVLIHCTKPFIKEATQEEDEYFIRLTWNNKEE